VLLTVFVMGVAVGVIGMVPRWWKHRRLAQLAKTPTTTEATQSAPSTADTTHGI
jgi:putative membrane protein